MHALAKFFIESSKLYIAKAVPGPVKLNTSNSLNSLISNTDDASKIKTGKLAQSIYNENFNNDETKRNANLVNNLSYRNLLILPNDNGIQKVRFDVILLETYKNTEQMHGIIQGCKKYEYIYKNGIFINHDFIKPHRDENNDENKDES